MALPKALRFTVVLLVICYILEHQGYRESMSVFFEELIGTAHTEAREKRMDSSNSSQITIQNELEELEGINTTDLLVIDVVLDLSLPASFEPLIQTYRERVASLPLPYSLSPSVTILDLNFTTLCAQNSTGGLQCQCEEQFAWSCDKCDRYGACSDSISQSCRCIHGLTSDGEFCEPVTNVAPCPSPTPVTTPMVTTTTAMATTTPMIITTPTPTSDLLVIDVVLDLSLPASFEPLIQTYRERVASLPLPYSLSPSVTILDLNFTTLCAQNSTGGLQCQCEEQFAWSCDKCDRYGACSDSISQSCRCIHGLPSDGEFCEPVTNVAPCPSPTPVTTTTPVVTTTTPMVTTTTPVVTTTTPMPIPSHTFNLN
ncbi:uncharacterized protein PB18E9.04c [Plectropomus leopardus]|uniref:uncharacterized protein PB18E9.04c n=1 Tax=Plectropomus leopardus TaxID=160734 RepID=UPI001C4AF4CB|nr:uncharacterized protein PB18E9.04c [Plectropomus leopardus]